MQARRFFPAYHTSFAPNKADSVSTFLLKKLVQLVQSSCCHVGHMEQHPGAQEAAGLSAGEAAAAAEGPRAAVRRYVHPGGDKTLMIVSLIN